MSVIWGLHVCYVQLLWSSYMCEGNCSTHSSSVVCALQLSRARQLHAAMRTVEPRVVSSRLHCCVVHHVALCKAHG
jgi:hypothetical protein